MPAVECLNCGGLTNTAFADWLDCKKNDSKKEGWPQYADKCYMRHEGGEWVTGCAEEGPAPYHVTVAKRANENAQREKK